MLEQALYRHGRNIINRGMRSIDPSSLPRGDCAAKRTYLHRILLCESTTRSRMQHLLIPLDPLLLHIHKPPFQRLHRELPYYQYCVVTDSDVASTPESSVKRSIRMSRSLSGLFHLHLRRLSKSYARMASRRWKLGSPCKGTKM